MFFFDTQVLSFVWPKAWCFRIFSIYPFPLMKTLSTYVLVAALAALTVSCKKDGENAPAPSKTDLLTAKKWRITAASTVTTVGTNTSTTDDYAASPACERDDFTQFLANKAVTFDEGATKCSASDPQTTSGTWDFNSDQTKLNLTSPDLGGLLLPFDLVKLDATTLTIRYTQSQSGNTIVFNRTFTTF